MASPLTGQLAISASAQALSAPLGVTAFTIKAPLSNAHPVYIGAAGVTTSSGYQLDPGDTFDYERLSQNGAPAYQVGVSDFYAIGTSGDTISWLASPA